MSIVLQIIGVLVWVWIIGTLQDYFSEKRGNVRKDGYKKMTQQLIKLLQKDGFQNEMREGHITVTYRNERFMLTFDESQFGERYSRVTVADYYQVDGMDDVHPFVMDAVMARATYRCPRIINLSFGNHCLSTYSSDVNNIKDNYRGLRSVMDMLVANEQGVREDFVKFHLKFGYEKNKTESNHIGFKASLEEPSEKECQVAAETNINAK